MSARPAILTRRVGSYTQPNRLSNRIMRMVSETEKLEVIVTKSEIEALLLESNLIKKMKPRYNILLRDDKSLPQILLTADHEFGQLTKHRGRKTRKGEYFGPFASAGSVNRTVADLARAFMLRTCSDSVFASRTALSAISDQTLHRTLCWTCDKGRLCKTDGAGASFPVWRLGGNPARIRRKDAQRRGQAGIRDSRHLA